MQDPPAQRLAERCGVFGAVLRRCVASGQRQQQAHTIKIPALEFAGGILGRNRVRAVGSQQALTRRSKPGLANGA